MRNFPKDTTLNIDDFIKTDWIEVLNSKKEYGCDSLHNDFSAAARKAYDAGDFAKSKGLWLLADICSMMLNTHHINDPFQPHIVMEGKRSAIPEDFSEEDITFFAEILKVIDDNWLKSRIADVLWLVINPRDVKFGLTAIESYRALPIDPEAWNRNVRDCTVRSIQLCKMLGKGSGTALQEIEDTLLKLFLKHENDETRFLLGIARVLYDQSMGKKSENQIADKLHALGQSLETKYKYHIARDYYDVAIEWYSKKADVSKINEITQKIAECFIKEGKARVQSDSPSQMVANTLFEKALHRLRGIPKKYRADLQIDESIADVRQMIEESGKKALDEMGRISSPSVDISKIIKAAIETVEGKDIQSAFLEFANIYPEAKVDELRNVAKEMISKNPFQLVISSTHMSHDGRVVAKRAGIDLNDEDSEENNRIICAEMIKNYQIGLGLAVQGSIQPALRIMHAEHRIREDDFTSIARNSPIVPHGREYLFGKGLYAGYEYDFTSALHILTPQIENLVRWHLKKIRVATTTFDADGIEHEIGLSALLERPETSQLLGDDLLFEFKALYTDPFGSNLRNDVAHGLIDDKNSESVYSIYAWWLCVRLVFNTFWNTQNPEEEQVNQPKIKPDTEQNET